MILGIDIYKKFIFEPYISPIKFAIEISDIQMIVKKRIYMFRKLSQISPIEAHGHFPPSVTSTQQGLLGRKVFLSTARQSWSETKVKGPLTLPDCKRLT